VTEDEWLSCRDHEPMLEWLRGKAGERKLRLSACAIVRRAPMTLDGDTMWGLLPNCEFFETMTRFPLAGDEYGDLAWTEHEGFGYTRMNCHDVIEAAELRADGKVSRARWDAARELGRWAEWSAEADTFGYDSEVYPGSGLRYAVARGVGAVTEDGDRLATAMIWTHRQAALYGDEHSQCMIHPGFGDRVCILLRDIFGDPFQPVAIAPSWLTPRALKLALGIYEERAFDRMPILGDALEEAGCTDEAILDHCRQDREHVRGCWVVDLVLGKE
jgi:hypothetical protein